MGQCEAAMSDGTKGLERMFGVLVSRTANLLAGRVPGAGQGGSSSSPARPPTPGGRGGQQTSADLVTVTRGGGGGGGGAAGLAVMQMNERLAVENAQLLGEVARWQSGRHTLLRKMGLAVAGADPQQQQQQPAPSGPAPQFGYAAYVAAATGAPHSQQPPALTRSSSMSSTSGLGAGAAGGQTGQQQQPQQSPQQGGAPGSAVREALAAAVRDVLLAGRRELLPAVMTAEGWGEGLLLAGDGGGGGGSKAEAAIGAAESNVRLRAQVLALQADAVKLRASAGQHAESVRAQEQQVSRPGDR